MSRKSRERRDNREKEAENEAAQGNTDSGKISETVYDKSGIRKHNFFSGAFTAAVIAGVILLNVVVGIVCERLGAEIDLTETGLYTLDEKAADYLENTLSEDISIVVLSSEEDFSGQGTYFKQVSEMLRKMDKLTEHITLEFVDMTKDPTYASKYTGESLSSTSIIIENTQTGRYKILTQSDYFGLSNETALYYYYYYGYVFGSYIEQSALSAMIYVCDENPVKIAFLEGFNESDSSALQTLLSQNGYDVETVNLLQVTEIDESYDFAVIYAPLSDYDDAALKILDDYLDNDGKYGKNVYYVASTSQPQTPNIDLFLSDWGLSVGFSAIGQGSSEYRIIINGQQTAYAHLQEIPESSYTSDDYDGYTMGADLRPVYVLDRTQNTIEILMQTYSNAFLYPLDADESFDFSSVETGVYNDVVMSTKTASDGTSSRVCAIGSAQLSGSYFFSYSNANNSDFFLDLFDSVSGKDSGIAISPKTVSSVSFDMSESTANAFVVVLCVILPTLIIVTGVVIWVRRRHR